MIAAEAMALLQSIYNLHLQINADSTNQEYDFN